MTSDAESKLFTHDTENALHRSLKTIPRSSPFTTIEQLIRLEIKIF